MDAICSSRKRNVQDLKAGAHGIPSPQSQVPSPIHVSMPHRGGKVPTIEPQETIKIG